uniref:Uncharacterized protein n=1 Tax=Rhizophora mucronata TaxID=61149 RepID=A0A2P2JJS4_RHIMU
MKVKGYHQINFYLLKTLFTIILLWGFYFQSYLQINIFLQVLSLPYSLSVRLLRLLFAFCTQPSRYVKFEIFRFTLFLLHSDIG